MNSLLHKNNPVVNSFMLHSKSKPFLQAKLTINEPGDIYEQEADAMADRVMRMSSNETAKQVTGLIGKSLQRKCAQCEEEEKRKQSVMRKTADGNAGMAVSSSFASSLHTSIGGGTPLPQGTKNFMENAFSADFSNVKVHTDNEAAELSKRINAKAFTYGSDIYFNSSEFSPVSENGKKLLAHELTHVIQQASGNANQGIQRWAYGSGTPPTATGRRFVVVPATHRTGANGIDSSLALIDRLISRNDWRGRTCRNFFGAPPSGHCPSGETLAQLHARAVIWFEDIAPANVGATTLGTGPNLGYTQFLFDFRSRWALAASILHEYIHFCGENDHTVGDNAKIACGLPDL